MGGQGGFGSLQKNQFGAPPRFGTWNEILVGNSVLIAVILLRWLRNPNWRRLLAICIPVLFLGLYATQTRGIWMSTAGCLLVYALMNLALALIKRRPLAGMLKGWAAALMGAVALWGVFKFGAGVDLYDKISMRVVAHKEMEFVDPSSSLGFRLYESHRVWQERTWLGHGSGTTIRLWKPTKTSIVRMDWWGIHMEYAEILHKFGVVGLGLFLLLLGSAFWRSFRLAAGGRGFPSAMGFITLLALMNTAVFSLTSGYFLREPAVVYLLFFLVILKKFPPRPARHAEPEIPA